MRTASIPAPLAYQDHVPTAVIDVLGKVCGLHVCHAPPREESLAAMVSFVGDVEWSVLLGMPKTTAIGLARAFAGFDIPFESDDMGDFAGELANLLAGETKKALFERGLETHMSLPTVFRGRNMARLHASELPGVLTWFESPCGRFWVEVVAEAGPALGSAAPGEVKFPPSTQALLDRGDSDDAMRREFRSCAAQALVDVFRSVCTVELRAMPAGTAEHSAEAETVIATISLIGGVDWSLYLGLPRETAVAAAKAFAGFDIPFDSDDMGDAAGELANLVAGDTKIKLHERGLKVEISLPNVMRGSNISVAFPREQPEQTVCFDGPLGGLWLTVVEDEPAAQ